MPAVLSKPTKEKEWVRGMCEKLRQKLYVVNHIYKGYRNKTQHKATLEMITGRVLGNILPMDDE